MRGKLPPFVLLALVFGSLGVPACSVGELHLLDRTDEKGAAGAPSHAPTGGSSAIDPQASGGSGGSGGCSGSDCPGSPCGQAGDGCLAERCDKNGEHCACTTDQDCPPGRAPICSAAKECVECATAQHCFGLYGGAKPVCWAGKCSGCQGDQDCPYGLKCEQGGCGLCADDLGCPQGLLCKDEHCAPR